MKDAKVRQFMQLAGQSCPKNFTSADPKTRALGAQLLLSEVLEYVIHGLNVTPTFNGTPITEPNQLQYDAASSFDKEHMLDGLSDTAYTMYWNALTFGLPLEEAFEVVCDNNLEKFVKLEFWSEGERPLESNEWDCKREITWPPEVVAVKVVKVGQEFYAVGTDKSGKVRKPSTYKPVDLKPLLDAA